MRNQNITVSGTARNGKEGALILTEDGSVYYLDGLEKWEPTTEGNEISVSGVLRIESIYIDEMKNEKGEWKSGVVGEKNTIQSAQWKVIEK